MRFPPYHETPEAAKRAVIALHVDGWNAKRIGAYLGTSRQTVQAAICCPRRNPADERVQGI